MVVDDTDESQRVGGVKVIMDQNTSNQDTTSVTPEGQTTAFVEALVKETERELDRVTEKFSFPLPGQGAKADVLFNAVGVFACKGIADTTVQDLLDAANISRRTFYKYFKNKVDVLENIYKIATDILITRFNAEMSSASTMSEFLVSCVDLYFDYHVNLGPLVRMMMEEARRTDSPLAVHRDHTIEEIVSLFDKKYFEIEGVHLDPQVYYAIIWALESTSIQLLTETDCTQQDVDRCKASMRALAARVLVSDESLRPPLPVRQE